MPSGQGSSGVRFENDGPGYGESSPVEILMKINITEHAMFFRDGGQMVKNCLSFALKCESKHSNGN